MHEIIGCNETWSNLEPADGTCKLIGSLQRCAAALHVLQTPAQSWCWTQGAGEQTWGAESSTGCRSHHGLWRRERPLVRSSRVDILHEGQGKRQTRPWWLPVTPAVTTSVAKPPPRGWGRGVGWGSPGTVGAPCLSGKSCSSQ